MSEKTFEQFMNQLDEESCSSDKKPAKKMRSVSDRVKSGAKKVAGAAKTGAKGAATGAVAGAARQITKKSNE